MASYTEPKNVDHNYLNDLLFHWTLKSETQSLLRRQESRSHPDVPTVKIESH